MRLYTGATVLTIDQDRRVLTDGALAVDGHTLTAVGPRQELEARYPSAERIELDGGSSSRAWSTLTSTWPSASCAAAPTTWTPTPG